MSTGRHDFDVIVVGSGFGGSVTALRLAEKGYRVGVMESGRRFAAGDFARTNWDIRRYLWAPRLGLRGIQRLNLLGHVLVLSGAGVGGGSLVYANTLYEPPDAFFADPQWADITDWRAELAPAYALAKRMLGVVEAPADTPADAVIRKVAERMGVADTFRPTRIGVYLGEPGRDAPDPFFGGIGPARTGCLLCGGCMVGCRHGAKNSVDLNYLYLAERAGATVLPEHQVVDVERLAGNGFRVVTERPGAWLRKRRRTHTAGQVVFAAGALGTLRLLHRLADMGRLPGLSERMGHQVRTNSEAIVGATAWKDAELSRGVAITSSIYPEPHTHIEPVRFPSGSNLMGLLATVMVDGGGRVPRPLRFLATVARHPIVFLRSITVRRWADRSVILLTMQTLDNSLRVGRRRGPFGMRLVSAQEHGRPNPTYIPEANRAARIAAEEIGGHASSALNEVLLDVPTTAHLIGGAPIGASPADGAIDAYHRVFGEPGLHVVDGAAVPANLGVNPSLTITALAERAMSFWPNAGEGDPRPPLGERYRSVAPVAPRRPVFPT